MSICMCTGNCPIREYCYRYMKEPNPYGQTLSHLEDVCIPDNYSGFVPYDKNIKKEDNIEKDNKEISYTLDDFIMDEMKKVNKLNEII